MRGRRRAIAAIAAVVIIVPAGSGCGGDRSGTLPAGGTPASGALTDSAPAESMRAAGRQLADSAVADSAAFEALPPSLAAALDVRRVFDPAFLADTSRAYCQPLGPEDAPHVRRRIRARLGDTLLVLFARADRQTGALQRVELVRRPLDGGLQHGFTWDAASDEAYEVDWTADVATATQSGRIPRSSPAPGAIRALGRLVLSVPCTGSRRP